MSMSKKVYQEIMEKAIILQVFLHYAGRRRLKKMGSWNPRYVTSCPFHNDSTPSFFLFPTTNSFTCYGCGEAGNQIDLVRLLDPVECSSHFECIQKLAEIARVVIPSGRTNLVRARRRVRRDKKKSKNITEFKLETQQRDKIPF